MTDAESPEANNSVERWHWTAGDPPHDLKAHLLTFNLQQVVQFHQAVQIVLAEHQRRAETVDEKVIQDAVALYRELNSGNTLLLALAFLEEMLVFFWRQEFPGKAIPDGPIRDRYVDLFSAWGVKLGTVPSWAVLLDAIEVRNCLLHANGRISYMRSPKGIERCIDKYDDLKVERGRVRVGGEFLEDCIRAIEDFRDEVVGCWKRRDGVG